MKIILVGASGTIGSQINSNPAVLKKLEENPKLKVVQFRLPDSESAKALVEEVVGDAGRLDILVNTIGPFFGKDILSLSPQEWDLQLHLNLNLAFYLANAAQNYLVQSKGHLMNFAFSGADLLKARPESTAYCISKAGVVVLTKSLAAALARSGVRVNAISPGLIEAGEVNSEERKKMADAVPAGRPGTPAEVAQVLSWILNESPAYLTGALIPVSGAWEYL